MLKTKYQIPKIIYPPKKQTPHLNMFDCDDCDAPVTPLIKLKNTPFQQSLPYFFNYQTQPLTSEYTVGYHPIYNQPLVFNNSSTLLLSHFKSEAKAEAIPTRFKNLWGTKTLNNFFRQAVELGLLISKKHKKPVLTPEPSTLTAWLHLTDRCNLRCVYCYLPHHNVDMSLAVGKAAIQATIRSALKHNYKTVKLKYAGGETLLCFSLLIKLHSYAQNLAKKHKLNLQGVVLSNGTLLTSAMTQQLKDLNLNLMISLDGLTNYQNAQRVYAGGQATFDDVKRGIEIAQSHNLTPYISITISNRNIAGLPALLTWILSQKLPFGLSFYRQNNFSQAYTNLQLEEESIIKGMLAAYKVIEANLPQHSLLTSLADRANLATPHLHTCGVGHNYLVFNHQGQISKCHSHQNAFVASIADDDPLILLKTDTNGIQNISVEDKTECQACEWKYWCAGGCPLVTYQATGRYDVKSPNCAIYKALYPAVMRLEGLRLLKYGEVWQPTMKIVN